MCCGGFLHPGRAYEKSQEQGSGNTSYAMNAKCIKAVVVTQFVFSLNSHITYLGSQNSKYHCSVWLNYTGCRSDCYKTGQYSDGKSESSCFSLMKAFNYDPGQSSRSCCYLCCC